MEHSPYQPLSRENREIRVFDLFPGKGKDAVTGRLRVVSLKEKPKFDCLSYVWGASKPQTTISLEGGYSLSIGPNLHLALSDIRRKWRLLTLWVDALCINQQDDQEKAYQVPMMSQLYREARLTRAWLNYEVDPKCPALRALPWLAEEDIYPEDNAPTVSKNRANTTKRLLGMLEGLESHDWDFWKPATDIFKNEYWSRLWIQQELIVSGDVQFHLRQCPIAGRHLFRLRDNLLRSFTYAEYACGADHPGRWLNRGYLEYLSRNVPDLQRIRRGESTTPFVFVVTRSHGFRASNPLDLVYGCLALAHPSERGALRVDYSLPPPQVYADVVRNHLRHWKNVDFVLFSSFGSFKPRPELPTWLPTPERQLFYEVNLDVGTVDLDWLGIPASVSDDGRCLEVKACQLDTVAHSPRKGCVDAASVVESMQAIRDCYLELHPGATDADVWTSKGLVGIVQWPLPHGGDADPLQGLDGAARELLEAARHDPPGELGWDAALTWAAGRPGADGDVVRALGNLRLHLDWQLPVATRRGRLGLVGCASPAVPPRPADQIWLVAGCSQPVVLRARESAPGQFRLVGTVFFAEFMGKYNTEVWQWFQRRVLAGETLEDFTQRIVLV